VLLVKTDSSMVRYIVPLTVMTGVGAWGWWVADEPVRAMDRAFARCGMRETHPWDEIERNK
jgi:hypothetical protein